jgi:phosphate transport system permease protein
MLLRGTLGVTAVAAAAIVALIAIFLLRESLPALRSVGPWRFFTDPSWHPAGGGRFNLTPMLVGTLAATTGAILLATPLGLASAVFCRFYGSARLATVYRRLVELSAGIPSVVYGFWGLVVLLAGILILALMILPTIALLGEAALASVPRSFLHGAAALGLGRWAIVRGVAIPAARSGLLTSVLLALTRALGETMAVLMVAGNVVRVPSSVFDPVRTLTANIALELGYAAGDHRAALFVTGLVLMGMVVLLVGTAEWVSRGRVHA